MPRMKPARRAIPWERICWNVTGTAVVIACAGLYGWTALRLIALWLLLMALTWGGERQ
jgi:hypothetical protein